ncbi:MAG: hypothetical protein Q9174_004098 [Haloplaca sp. 1 TL-2023]
MFLSYAIQTLSCDIHENCDGTCSDGVHYPGPPLIDELQYEMLSMFSQIAAPQPSLATPQDIPHDARWLEQQSLPEFKYSAISSLEGQIRLLRVKKALFRADIVECEVVTTFLGQGQQFQALSYCWGTGGMTDVMLCDGKKISITPSLNAALKNMREGRKLQDELLWADAVSINQADKVEVGEQIPLMRQIYTEAAGVFVHLGLDGRRLSRGLDLMLRAATVHRHLTSPEEYGAVDVDETRWPSAEHPCWEEYLTLFQSPWISRTWILQETVLAKHATLGVGRYMLEWEAFDQSVHLLKERGLLTQVSRGSPMGVMNFMRHQEIQSIARSPKNHSLIRLLKVTRHFQVTDPRDKVVAILGVHGDPNPELKALSDRSLSTAQVYHRTALYLIGTPDDLPFLFAHAGLQRQAGPSEMPSWVPDWYADNSTLNERPLYDFRRTSYWAGGHHVDCMIGVVSDHPLYPRQLACPGFCDHRIIKWSNVAGDPTRPTPKMNIAWYESARMCLESSEPLIYQHQTEEAFARTLLVDDLYEGNNALPGTATIEDAVTTLQAAIAILKVIDSDGEISDNVMVGTTTAQVRTCVMQVAAATRNRRFAITDTGYMCLVPSCAEIGDLVAIFPGCPTPFTIRLDSKPETSEHGLQQICARLVGDTYVHGLMDGETMMEAAQTRRMPSLVLLN